MAGTMRGADHLVAGLRAAGTDTVFTLSGNHIMSVFDALFGQDIALIHTRHEAAAVHMADAHARITGRCGIALVTGGQGHTNAVAALTTAHCGESPLVLLSGHAPLDEVGTGSFQELDNVALAAPVTKAAWAAPSAAGLADDLARAIRIARSGRPGPVHLSLPTDVLDATLEPRAAPAPHAFATLDQPLPPAMAAAVRAALAAARRPLILAPPALSTPPGRAALDRLHAALGVPVLMMESPRGIADATLGAVAEILAAADCVLLLGKALDFTLRFGRAPTFAPGCQWIVLDPDAAMLARAARALGDRLALSALCGAREAAAALTAAPGAPGHHAWAEEVGAATAHRPAAWAAHRAGGAGPVHPVALCAALQPHLAHPDTILVCDGGEIGQWAQSLLHAPFRVTNSVAGAIGASIPFAAAAARARPGAPVLAVAGDGTFGFHMAEFDTAARHGLPFTAIVGNDACWNAERQIQLRDYGAARAHGCALAPATRYDQVVAALGGHGEFVTTAADLAPALARATASGRPACVNVLIEGMAAPVVRRG